MSPFDPDTAPSIFEIQSFERGDDTFEGRSFLPFDVQETHLRLAYVVQTTTGHSEPLSNPFSDWTSLGTCLFNELACLNSSLGRLTKQHVRCMSDRKHQPRSQMRQTFTTVYSRGSKVFLLLNTVRYDIFRDLPLSGNTSANIHIHLLVTMKAACIFVRSKYISIRFLSASSAETPHDSPTNMEDGMNPGFAHGLDVQSLQTKRTKTGKPERALLLIQ